MTKTVRVVDAPLGAAKWCCRWERYRNTSAENKAEKSSIQTFVFRAVWCKLRSGGAVSDESRAHFSRVRSSRVCRSWPLPITLLYSQQGSRCADWRMHFDEQTENSLQEDPPFETIRNAYEDPSWGCSSVSTHLLYFFVAVLLIMRLPFLNHTLHVILRRNFSSYIKAIFLIYIGGFSSFQKHHESTSSHRIFAHTLLLFPLPTPKREQYTDPSPQLKVDPE